MKIFRKILEILFPNHCLYCDCLIDNKALFCQNCWPKLQFISNPKCTVCAYPFEFQASTSICLKCLQTPPAFDETITVFRYNFVIKKVILAMKYGDQSFIAKKLSPILFRKIKDRLNEFDLLVAVPLHKKRLQKRKFNQAVLLAKNLHKLAPQLVFYPDFLLRIKHTKSQSELRKKEREKNLKSAFIINPKYQQLAKTKRILLIDDVTTTSATLNQCAKSLKKSGAVKITTLTIAKTTLI